MGEICPRSDPDIAHMKYSIDPLKLIYRPIIIVYQRAYDSGLLEFSHVKSTSQFTMLFEPEGQSLYTTREGRFLVSPPLRLCEKNSVPLCLRQEILVPPLAIGKELCPPSGVGPFHPPTLYR